MKENTPDVDEVASVSQLRRGVRTVPSSTGGDLEQVRAELAAWNKAGRILAYGDFATCDTCGAMWAHDWSAGTAEAEAKHARACGHRVEVCYMELYH